MSERSRWLAAPVELQRRNLELSRRLARRNVRLQRRLSRAFVESLDAQRGAQREAIGLYDNVLRSLLAMQGAAAPGDQRDLQEAFDAWLTTLEDVQGEWNAVVARSVADGLEASDGLLGLYGTFLDASFDAALDANERLATGPAWAPGPAGEAVEVAIDEEGG